MAFPREVSRNEFLGDVSSRFPRLFGVPVQFHAKLERPVRCDAVFEFSINNVCRSFGVFVDVVTGLCESVRWWHIFGRRCIRNAVYVDAFYILVPLDNNCSLVGLEHAERSKRWAFELTSLRHSVGLINVHVVTLPYVSLDLLSSSVEVTLVPLLRLH